MKKKLPDSLLFQAQFRKCDKRFVFCIGVFVSSCRKENTVLPIAADNSVLKASSV